MLLKRKLNELRDYITNVINPYTLISGFHRDADEICALLGYYAALCGNCLPMFQGSISVPSSRVKSPRRKESGQAEPQRIRWKVRAVTGKVKRKQLPQDTM
jgi:hypothetical protein